MEKIIVYKPVFEIIINELIEILYNEEYFGFHSSAVFYVQKIYDFIDKNIEKPISRQSPYKFQKFGKFYIKYQANHQTTWYIFFDRKDNRFLVNHILNNHAEGFSDLL